jgi:hypothetical protein
VEDMACAIDLQESKEKNRENGEIRERTERRQRESEK